LRSGSNALAIEDGDDTVAPWPPPALPPPVCSPPPRRCPLHGAPSELREQIDRYRRDSEPAILRELAEFVAIPNLASDLPDIQRKTPSTWSPCCAAAASRRTCCPTRG
jgi:hypothetical protein